MVITRLEKENDEAAIKELERHKDVLLKYAFMPAQAALVKIDEQIEQIKAGKEITETIKEDVSLKVSKIKDMLEVFHDDVFGHSFQAWQESTSLKEMQEVLDFLEHPSTSDIEELDRVHSLVEEAIDHFSSYLGGPMCGCGGEYRCKKCGSGIPDYAEDLIEEKKAEEYEQALEKLSDEYYEHCQTHEPISAIYDKAIKEYEEWIRSGKE